MLYQTFVAPGSGTVYVQGQLDYSTTTGGTSGTGWVRLDLYNSTNTTFVANLSCETFNANTNLHTTTPVIATITGGTTYTIRVSIRSAAAAAKATTIVVDNVVVTAAPLGLTASAPADTSNAALSWTASTAVSGAPGLHATTPYKVYRGTSSPVTTSNFLANATTNSYTDTSATGNTTYYFAVTNMDTSNIESSLSAEATVLTRPGAPGAPTFSNNLGATLTASWTAPTGGAPNYYLERCSGSGCSNYAPVGGTLTATSYNDSGLTPGTMYQYRVRAGNTTGYGPYSSSSSVTATVTVSVTMDSNGTVNYSVLPAGTSKSTIELANTQTARNDGNVTETFNIKTSAATGGTGWQPGATPSNDIFVHQFSTNGGGAWTTFPAAESYQTLSAGVLPGGTKSFDLKITVPTTSTDFQAKSITVTIQAVQQ